MKAEKLYSVIVIDFDNLEAAEGEIVHEGLPLREAERLARDIRIEYGLNVLVVVEETGRGNLLQA